MPGKLSQQERSMTIRSMFSFLKQYEQAKVPMGFERAQNGNSLLEGFDSVQKILSSYKRLEVTPLLEDKFFAV